MCSATLLAVLMPAMIRATCFDLMTLTAIVQEDREREKHAKWLNDLNAASWSLLESQRSRTIEKQVCSRGHI